MSNKSEFDDIFNSNNNKDSEMGATINLPGIKEFLTKSRQIIDEAPFEKYAIIAIDIDFFKLFNELYGRELGDRCLEEIATRLDRQCKELGGVAGYFGMDDFAVMIPWNEDYYSHLNRQINDHIFKYNMEGFYPSFGINVISDNSLSISSLYDRAVLALSHVKGNYTEHISVYSEVLHDKIKDERMLLIEVQKALQDGDFIFYLQPKCNTKSDKIVGSEALVRWLHPKKGIVPPNEYIPMLEENGYIVPLDCYVWEAVCKWQRSLIDRNIKPLPCSVNVSRIDFYFIDVADHFNKYTEKYGISHDLIEIEITESAYADDSFSFKKSIEDLKNAGYTILMDDFGSGYSSLNTLRTIKVDILKTDMKFLDVSKKFEEKTISIIESIFSMARELGVTVIAEGVETEHQLKCLLDMGCTYVQGYYYYKPMPVEEFEKLLTDGVKIDYSGFCYHPSEQLHIREFLDRNLYSETVLNNILGPVLFAELDEADNMKVVRVNEPFYKLVGIDGLSTEDFIYEMYKRMPDPVEVFLNIFHEAQENLLTGAKGDLHFITTDQRTLVFHSKVFYLCTTDKKRLFYVSIRTDDMED
ncbi:MAG: EAL domain-containing protein [Butyrivibrio sp.]|nr:EAL domain-containing protein [Butyrivibrio sp.]